LFPPVPSSKSQNQDEIGEEPVVKSLKKTSSNATAGLGFIEKLASGLSFTTTFFVIIPSHPKSEVATKVTGKLPALLNV